MKVFLNQCAIGYLERYLLLITFSDYLLEYYSNKNNIDDNVISYALWLESRVEISKFIINIMEK
jgi:hypothetical protein